MARDPALIRAELAALADIRIQILALEATLHAYRADLAARTQDVDTLLDELLDADR